MEGLARSPSCSLLLSCYLHVHVFVVFAHCSYHHRDVSHRPFSYEYLISNFGEGGQNPVAHPPVSAPVKSRTGSSHYKCYRPLNLYIQILVALNQDTSWFLAFPHRGAASLELTTPLNVLLLNSWPGECYICPQLDSFVHECTALKDNV